MNHFSIIKHFFQKNISNNRIFCLTLWEIIDNSLI